MAIGRRYCRKRNIRQFWKQIKNTFFFCRTKTYGLWPYLSVPINVVLMAPLICLFFDSFINLIIYQKRRSVNFAGIQLFSIDSCGEQKNLDGVDAAVRWCWFYEKKKLKRFRMGFSVINVSKFLSLFFKLKSTQLNLSYKNVNAHKGCFFYFEHYMIKIRYCE